MAPIQADLYNTFIAAVISLTLILFVFGFSIFHHLRRKQIQLKSKSFQDECNLEVDRKRIAADLHDDFGSLLTGLKLSLNELALKDPSKLLFHSSTEQLNASLLRLNEISLNLLPRELESEGLNSAVESLVERINNSKRIRVNFSSTPETNQFTTHKAMLLYRVIQEITTNAIKHSKAGTIDIGIARRGNDLILEIRDDGSGFNYEQSLQKKNRSGLKNIRSRLDLLDAILIVESKTGIGTHYFIKIPLRQLNDGSES
ncbi:MAG: ATP-binding protein [Sediminibacterium sp.]